MANVKIYKDDHSFHIFNLIDYGEEISYDFSLSRVYSVVLGKGIVNIETDITPFVRLESISLHNISVGEKLNCAAIENTQAAFLVSVLLEDSLLMGELIPNSTLLNQLLSSQSNLTSFTYEDHIYKNGPTESYEDTSGNIILTVNDIESKIIEGLGL